MSVVNKGVLDQLGIESKKVLQALAISAKDLIGAVDLNDSITKENIVTVELINGKYITKVRIPNNVIIYKEDLKEIPLLLTVIDQGDISGNMMPLENFPIDIQVKIMEVFMIHYGYATKVDNNTFFTSHILDLFNTSWWINIFELARNKTLNFIDLEVENGSQPVKNREIIYNTGLISMDQFKSIEPTPGMNILWALGIYFFDKIVRNWVDRPTPDILATDTIMDIDLSPGKYIKTLDAKTFFINQLRIFLGLRPNKIWFGGLYQSKFFEMIQKKDTKLNKIIILEELNVFTRNMNIIYSGGNNVLNGPNDSGTEPFAILDVVYNEIPDGIHTNIEISIHLQINLYGESNVYKLPVTTKIN